MRKLLYVVLALVVLVVAAVVALPYIVPQDVLRTTVADQLEQAAGRDVELRGDVAFQVVPRPAVSLGGLTIAGNPTVEAPPLVTVGELDAQLALMPLLSGEVQVDRFVLRGLAVELVVDEAGRASWAGSVSPAAASGAGTVGADGATADAGDGGAPATGPALPPVRLGDVRLVDGAIRYTDRAAGVERAFENVDGTVAMTALDQPLNLDLAGDLDGRRVELAGRLSALAPLLRGGGTTTGIDLASEGLEVGFDGDVVAGNNPSATGALDVDLRQAPATVSWLAGRSVELPVETARLTGRLSASPGRVDVDDLQVAVDEVEGTGNLSLDLDRARPLLAGRLDLGEVDLAAFGMGGEEEAPAPGRSGDATTQTADDDPATADASDTAAPSGDGWSREPIGYAHPALDLDLALTVEGLRTPPLQFGAGSLDVQGDAERVLVTLESLALYDGTANGSVRLAPRSAGLALTQDVRVQNVRTAPLLADLVGNDFLDGRANLDFAVETTGASPHDLVAAADGGGSFGVDSAILSGLRGKPELEALRALLALGGEPGAPLRIAAANGTIDLQDGVATNRDLVATTANLRITGEGRIDLVNRRIPGYTLTPEATGALAGMQRLQAVLVPLEVQGPFDDLRVRPDPGAVGEAAVEDVERALESAAEKAREGDLEGAAETIINEGLGGALERFGIRP